MGEIEKMQIPQYTSLQEKASLYRGRYRCITSIDDFEAWLEPYIRIESHGYIYRGINEACYKNFTSLQRYVISNDIPSEIVNKLISEQLLSLKELSPTFLLDNYCMSVGIPCSDIYLLSFIQHYAGFTPLLDFTLNPRVALYFMSLGDGANCEDVSVDDIHSYVSIYMRNESGSPFLNLGRNVRPAPLLELYHSRNLTSKIFEKVKDLTNNQDNLDVQKVYQLLYKNFESQFSFANLNELSKDKPIIIAPSYWQSEKIQEQRYNPSFAFTNFNLVAQRGCFVYNNSSYSLDKYLFCVDIHKSLIPYIKKKYLKYQTFSALFPNNKRMVKNAFNQAQKSLL